MKIFEIFDKLKKFDKLQADFHQLQVDFHNLEDKSKKQNVFIKNLVSTLNIKQTELEIAKRIVEEQESLTNKDYPLYNDISKPELNLKEIEASLKLSDKFTLSQIIHYLKLDNFEFVKSIA